MITGAQKLMNFIVASSPQQFEEVLPLIEMFEGDIQGHRVANNKEVYLLAYLFKDWSTLLVVCDSRDSTCDLNPYVEEQMEAAAKVFNKYVKMEGLTETTPKNKEETNGTK